MFTVQLGNGTSPQAHSWEVVLIGSESGCVASQPCSSQHSLFSDKPLVNLSNDKWYFWHAEVGHQRLQPWGLWCRHLGRKGWVWSRLGVWSAS